MYQKRKGRESPCCVQGLTAPGETSLLCKAHLGFHFPRMLGRGFPPWPERWVSWALRNSHLIEHKKAEVFLIFPISYLYQIGKEKGLEGRKPSGEYESGSPPQIISYGIFGITKLFTISDEIQKDSKFQKWIVIIALWRSVPPPQRLHWELQRATILSAKVPMWSSKGAASAPSSKRSVPKGTSGSKNNVISRPCSPH